MACARTAGWTTGWRWGLGARVRQHQAQDGGVGFAAAGGRLLRDDDAAAEHFQGDRTWGRCGQDVGALQVGVALDGLTGGEADEGGPGWQGVVDQLCRGEEAGRRFSAARRLNRLTANGVGGGARGGGGPGKLGGKLGGELGGEIFVHAQALHRRLGATMIYVTHDQVEAMTMADKIVVLRAGSIEQVGSPLELYNSPNNKFVAGFIGSPQMNFAPVTAGHGDSIVTEYGETFALKTESKPVSGTALTLGVRPEHLTLDKRDDSLAMPITISGVEQLGGHSLIYGTLSSANPGADGPRITAQVAGQVTTKIGETANLYAPPEACRLFEASGEERAVR